MIVVEIEQNVSDLLSQLDLAMGFVKIDQNTLELVKVGHDELYIIETEILENSSELIKEKLLNCFAIIAIGPTNNDLATMYPNLVSIIDNSCSENLIKNKIDFLSRMISEMDIMKSQLLSINNELNDVMTNIDDQLLKIKSVYEKRLPNKLPQTKGIKLYSKYSAGESNGGEFFDFYQTENNIFLIMSSTDSYLASSSILTIFNELKRNKHIGFEEETTFVSDVLSEIDKINLHKNKAISISLFTVVIDTKTLEIKGHNVGSFNLHTSGSPLNKDSLSYKTNWKVSDYEFDGKFKREDRFLIVSPGLAKNLSDISPLTNLETLIRDSSQKTIHLLDEIFFQIKKDMKSDFLEYDASAILLEVDKNVMHTV